MRDTQTKTHTLGILAKERQMGKAFTDGPMVRPILAIGLMGRKKGKEPGKLLIKTHM